jgi:hypothetical protein
VANFIRTRLRGLPKQLYFVGVELGIKLSDDMEIAIQTEKLTVALFGSIEIGDKKPPSMA